MEIYSNKSRYGNILKLSIQSRRSVPLGEGPERITYQEETSTFGVITRRIDVMDKVIIFVKIESKKYK